MTNDDGWISVDDNWIEALKSLNPKEGKRHQYRGEEYAAKIVSACPEILRSLITREALKGVHEHMRKGGTYRELLGRLNCDGDYMLLLDDGAAISSLISAKEEPDAVIKVCIHFSAFE